MNFVSDCTQVESTIGKDFFSRVENSTHNICVGKMVRWRLSWTVGGFKTDLSNVQIFLL